MVLTFIQCLECHSHYTDPDLKVYVDGGSKAVCYCDSYDTGVVVVDRPHG